MVELTFLQLPYLLRLSSGRVQSPWASCFIFHERIQYSQLRGARLHQAWPRYRCKVSIFALSGLSGAASMPRFSTAYINRLTVLD